MSCERNNGFEKTLNREHGNKQNKPGESIPFMNTCNRDGCFVRKVVPCNLISVFRVSISCHISAGASQTFSQDCSFLMSWKTSLHCQCLSEAPLFLFFLECTASQASYFLRKCLLMWEMFVQLLLKQRECQLAPINNSTSWAVTILYI